MVYHYHGTGFARHGHMRPETINADNNNLVTTVYSVHYVTMTDAYPPTSSDAVSSSHHDSSAAHRDASSTSSAVAQSTASSSRHGSSSASATSATSSHTILVSGAPHTTRTTSSSSSGSTRLGTPLNAEQSATSTSQPTQTASTSNSLSGGAKAGIAIGVILGIALVTGLVLLAFRRKRKQEEEGHQQLENEKTPKQANRVSSFFGGNNNLDSNGRAPRLSLRPVTQFLPHLGGEKVTEMSATGGLGGFLTPNAQPKNNSAWERRPASSKSDDSDNPFGNSAQPVDSAAAEKAAERAAENAPIPVVAAAAADPFMDRSRSPSPTQPTSPPKVGTAAAMPVGASNAKPMPNNVHRVQLDFKPSMEDELDLRAGQVVRILHEYDDGWALCMRMDRSKQGVAPRTCLSKMALKPRPTGPPQNGRPGAQSPSMRNSPSPPHGRSSPGPRNPMYPAPLSPGFNNRMQRPHVPAPYDQGRQRSNSYSSNASQMPGGTNAQQWRPISPAGPAPLQHRRSASMGQMVMGERPTHMRKTSPTSPPNVVPSRKPVPGQAI